MYQKNEDNKKGEGHIRIKGKRRSNRENNRMGNIYIPIYTVCVCICVCISVHICVYIYIYVHIYRMHIFKYTQACTRGSKAAGVQDVFFFWGGGGGGKCNFWR
jgi:hypothetical protein